MSNQEKLTGLDLLRSPFEAHQIGKLPKPTGKQTEIVKKDYTKGIRCKICGQWHHPDVIHLDYVGHAALTDRLLDCDLNWTWDPMVVDESGAPKFDAFGGLWIRLTVCGQTRIGYGHPDGKKGGDAVKEAIGDALRNAAMRFGAALDLWHKGELHVSDDPQENQRVRKTNTCENPPPPSAPSDMEIQTAIDIINSKATLDELVTYWKDLNANAKQIVKTGAVMEAKEMRKVELGG